MYFNYNKQELIDYQKIEIAIVNNEDKNSKLKRNVGIIFIDSPKYSLPVRGYSC